MITLNFKSLNTFLVTLGLLAIFSSTIGMYFVKKDSADRYYNQHKETLLLGLEIKKSELSIESKEDLINTLNLFHGNSLEKDQEIDKTIMLFLLGGYFYGTINIVYGTFLFMGEHIKLKQNTNPA